MTRQIVAEKNFAAVFCLNRTKPIEKCTMEFSAFNRYLQCKRTNLWFTPIIGQIFNQPV